MLNPLVTRITMKQPSPESIELWNARIALIGLIAALGAYAVSGQVIPGIW